MALDISADLMQATVQVEQALPNGAHIIGTGFLINDPTPDGRPRTVLVTANHVFDRMSGTEAHIGYRTQDKDGGWRFDPKPIVIRSATQALWAHQADHDVAAIVVKAPPEFAKAAIPLAWLASGDTIAKYAIGPGDEMMVLGYPQGLSADSAGFPILRAGRVASMIAPPKASPTFLLDFRVFPGNSGGPVFMSQADRRRPGSDQAEDVERPRHRHADPAGRAERRATGDPALSPTPANSFATPWRMCWISRGPRRLCPARHRRPQPRRWPEPPTPAAIGQAVEGINRRAGRARFQLSSKLHLIR